MPKSCETDCVRSTCLRKARKDTLSGPRGFPSISSPRKLGPGSFYPAAYRWERRHQKSVACQSAAFSRASFTRFRVREVTGNLWQAAYGRSTMACYPPHVSKVASYPTDFVGNAALKEQGAADWRLGISQKLQCFWDESVLRIKEQGVPVPHSTGPNSTNKYSLTKYRYSTSTVPTSYEQYNPPPMQAV